MEFLKETFGLDKIKKERQRLFDELESTKGTPKVKQEPMSPALKKAFEDNSQIPDTPKNRIELKRQLGIK